MATKCARRPVKAGKGETNIETLIERFRKMRALNCTDPYDVGLDEYVWQKFMMTTRSHFVARMF